MIRRLISSLYFKIFAAFWSVLVLLLVIVVTLANLERHPLRDLSPQKVEKMQQYAQSLEYIAQRFPYLTADEIARRLTSRKGVPLIILASREGNVVFPKMSPRAIRHFISIVEDSPEPQIKTYGRSDIAGPLNLNIRGTAYKLYVATPAKKAQASLADIAEKPVWLLLLAILVSTPLCLLLAWHLTKPIRHLEHAAKRVAQGEFEVKISLPDRKDEIGQLSLSFEQMVQSLSKMMENQHRLLSDISHELRSPLTRLRLAVALSRKRGQETNEINRIDGEAQKLESMINDLLNLSRTQVNAHKAWIVVPIDELFEDVVESAIFEANEINKTLSVTQWPDAFLRGNPEQLCSAFENLVRNALKYADQTVKVTTITESSTLKILIEDDGPGVPQDALEDIFRPFYRVSSARDRKTGGTGLGLAIAQNVATQHGGQIKAENRQTDSPSEAKPFAGLRVTLSIPLCVACGNDEKLS